MVEGNEDVWSISQRLTGALQPSPKGCCEQEDTLVLHIPKSRSGMCVEAPARWPWAQCKEEFSSAGADQGGCRLLRKVAGSRSLEEGHQTETGKCLNMGGGESYIWIS